MKIYMNFSADSGVDAYEYGNDWIWVQFKDGAVYEYTRASAGEQVVEAMKRLALLGRDLHAFINEHARSLYSRRLK
jgi:hypothetical protein